MDGISMADAFIPDMKSYQEAKALGIEDNLVLTTIKYDSSWISLMEVICGRIEYFVNNDKYELAFTKSLIDDFKRVYDYIQDSIKYKEAYLQLKSVKNSSNYKQIKGYLTKMIESLKCIISKGERYIAMAEIIKIYLNRQKSV